MEKRGATVTATLARAAAYRASEARSGVATDSGAGAFMRCDAVTRVTA